MFTKDSPRTYSTSKKGAFKMWKNVFFGCTLSCLLTQQAVFTDQVPGTVFDLVIGENAQALDLGDHNADGKEDVYFIDGNGDIKVFAPTAVPISTDGLYGEVNLFRQDPFNALPRFFNDHGLDLSILHDSSHTFPIGGILVTNGELFGDVQIELPQATVIGKFQLSFYHPPSHSHYEFKIEGLDSSGQWVKLNPIAAGSDFEIVTGEYSIKTDTAHQTSRIYDIETDNTQAFSFYKISLKNSHKAPQINEIRGYERALP